MPASSTALAPCGTRSDRCWRPSTWRRTWVRLYCGTRPSYESIAGTPCPHKSDYPVMDVQRLDCEGRVAAMQEVVPRKFGGPGRPSSEAVAHTAAATCSDSLQVPREAEPRQVRVSAREALIGRFPPPILPPIADHAPQEPTEAPSKPVDASDPPTGLLGTLAHKTPQNGSCGFPAHL